MTTAPTAISVPGGSGTVQTLPLGQQTMANGVNVCLASDQTPIPTSGPVGGATIATAQKSLTGAVSLIVAARTGVAGTGRVSVTIANPGPVTIAIGITGVTFANGHLVPPGGITLNTTAAIYGITGGSTQAISYMETY